MVSLSDARDRLDHWQRGWTPSAVALAVVKKFIDDRGPNLGVQIAYWGFFSVFALLLAFVAIVGFLFQGDPSFQKDVRDSALAQMPVIGPQLSANVGSLAGSGVALAIGVVAALWTGLGATLALGDALDRVWAVPRVARTGFIASRVRGLLLLASAGSLTVASTALVGLVTDAQIRPALAQVISAIVAIGVDLVVFVACFRLLTSADVTTRVVLPGAVVAAIAWLGLQAMGGVYVSRVVKGASETYGGFAVVVGLLSWLYLGAQVVLIAAEINVVLARRLWPRSIGATLGPADERALEDAVKAEQPNERMQIAASFEATRDRTGGASPSVGHVPAPLRTGPPPNRIRTTDDGLG
jgi:YihY family inner membrane protein